MHIQTPGPADVHHRVGGDGDVHMWYENDQSRSTDEDEDDDEEEEDPFVDNLIWQMEDLRDKVYLTSAQLISFD